MLAPASAAFAAPSTLALPRRPAVGAADASALPPSLTPLPALARPGAAARASRPVRTTAAAVAAGCLASALLAHWPGHQRGSRGRRRLATVVAAGDQRQARSLVTPGEIDPEDQDLFQEVTDYLERIGGKSTVYSILTLYPQAKEDFLRRHFNVSKMAVREESVVTMRVSEDRATREIDQTAKTVYRSLIKRGGAADLADICRRFAIPKQMLLDHNGGETFEEEPRGELRLKGGAFAVAAAAAAAKAVSIVPGKRKSSTALLTTAGAHTDDVAARRLRIRIEGLITSTGDGMLSVHAVYTALNLKACHALRRWFPRVGLKLSSNGQLCVPEWRLDHFRIRRGLQVAAFLSDSGGEAPLQAVLALIHRPTELEKFEEKNAGVLVQQGLAQEPDEAEEGDGPASGGSLADRVADRQRDQTALAILDPPKWIEAWVREYFKVDDFDYVTFESDELLRLPPPAIAAPVDPDLPPPPTYEEDVANVMKVEEELFLRYGRAHVTVLAGAYEGLKKKWFKRFFDLNDYDEVLDKSVQRQTKEAIAVAMRAYSEGGYSAQDAFYDYGCTMPWLQKHFLVEDGAILRDDDVDRKWDPPKAALPPNPFEYAKLKAPRGYIRKGNGKYGARKYGHNAGGVMY